MSIIFAKLRYHSTELEFQIQHFRQQQQQKKEFPNSYAKRISIQYDNI